MKLRYFGHSAFLIDGEILVDPWISNPLYQGKLDEIKGVKAILLTHGHGDHVGDTVEIAKRENCKVFCVYELGNLLEEEGVETVKGNVGGTFELEDYIIKMVPAIHSSSYKGKYAGVPVGYLLETPDGIRIYHAGDTYLFEEMRYIQCDIALLPIGGTYTMDIYDALKACEILKPKIVVPMHYDTFPEIRTDVDLFSERVQEMGIECVILDPGEEMEEEIEFE